VTARSASSDERWSRLGEPLHAVSLTTCSVTTSIGKEAARRAGRADSPSRRMSTKLEKRVTILQALRRHGRAVRHNRLSRRRPRQLTHDEPWPRAASSNAHGWRELDELEAGRRRVESTGSVTGRSPTRRWTSVRDGRYTLLKLRLETRSVDRSELAYREGLEAPIGTS